MSDDIEVRIARAEREYERVANAAFIAKSRLKSLATDQTSSALEIARTRAALDALEKKRASLRQTLERLESESNFQAP